MSLLPFLLVTGLGAIAALLFRGRERIATTIGMTTLVAAIAAALWIQPGHVLVVGEAGLATTDYLRLFLTLGAMVGLVLGIIGQVAGTGRDAPSITLGILATSALALALPDASLAVLAATAGGALGALVVLRPAGGRVAATVGTRVLGVTVVAGALAIAASAWIDRDLSELAAQPVVFGLAFLAFALAVAIRFGAIPFHIWTGRLADTVPESTLPFVTAWAPSVFAIVALAWADRSITPLLVDLDAVRAIVLVIAVSSIVLASVAAWIQDDIEHIVGYSIIGDAGVVMLAIAALDPAAWAPARTWILALVIARSAFAGWAAVMRTTFGTGRMDGLRGWAIRSPVLAVAFGLVVVASIGLPGLAAFEARADLVDLAVGGSLGVIVLAATFGPLAYYGRLLVVGLTRPLSGPTAGEATSGVGRPSFTPLDLTDLRGWLVRTWATNRLTGAAGGALLLSVLALAVSAGAFGGPEAAAGLPPSVQGAHESFDPGAPEQPIDSGAPEVPAASGSVAPS